MFIGSNNDIYLLKVVVAERVFEKNYDMIYSVGI